MLLKNINLTFFSPKDLFLSMEWMSLLKIQINQMGKSNQMRLEILLVELSLEGALATLTPLATLAPLAKLALSIMATLLLLQDPLVSVSEVQIGAVKRLQK